MKKNFFILGLFAIFVLSGLAFHACDDDDDSSPAPTVGEKKIDIRVVDENGTLTTANVSIMKGGALVNTLLVAGTYTLDVGKDPTNTVYSFKAARDGYIDSGEQSVTVLYASTSDSFSSYVVLQVTKKSSAVTLDPAKENTFTVPSSTSSGGSVQVVVPAGTFDKEVTLNPTVIPTAASKKEIEADAPNGGVALQIIDFASNWTGNFLNGNKITLTFPLTQGIIDHTVKKGISLLFGTNSGGQWESYPVTVNEANLTGTVSIPHFSTWYLTPSFTVNISIVQTNAETLGTGSCGESLTVTFMKDNVPAPDFYQKLFGWPSDMPDISQSNTEQGVDGKYWIVRGRCLQKVVKTEGTVEPIPDYTYFSAPVTFSSTAIDCTHNGGGGQ